GRFASRDADGAACGADYSKRAARRRKTWPASGVQVLGSWNDGDHWPVVGSGLDRKASLLGIARMAGLAFRAPDFSNRVPQQDFCLHPMDLFLPHLQAKRAFDYQPAAVGR